MWFFLYFSEEICYNIYMKKTDNYQTSNAEMVTISRAEYEKLQAQSKRVSELESRVDLLMEGLSVDQPKAHKPVSGLEIV